MDHHTSKFTQGLNMPVLSVIAIVGVLVVWVTVVGTQAYYDAGVRLEEQKKIIQPNYLAENEKTAKLLADQHANVTTDVMTAAKAAVIARYGKAKSETPKEDAGHATPGHH